MVLKPQDVFVLLKLWLVRNEEWTFKRVAHELFMSPSEVHAAVKRSTQAGLYEKALFRPRSKALLEFLIHGVKYAFPPDLGPMTRGIPTAFATEDIVKHLLVERKGREIYVWPHEEGEHRGVSLSPLYRSVPKAAVHDHKLYSLLGVLDCLRLNKRRYRDVAVKIFTSKLFTSVAHQEI